MPDVDFRYLLLGLLAIGLVYACVTDIRSRLIENWLTAAIALGAPLFWWASGMTLQGGMLWQLGMGAITFAVLAGLFFLGWIGGGDVKLLAALALWFPPMLFFKLVFMASVVGGVMTTIGSLLNLAPSAGRTAGRLIIWSSAALSVVVMLYVGWVLNGGAPLNLTGYADQLIPFGSAQAGLMIMLLLVMAYISAGSIVMARHQRARLRIPYGVAISAGGIWAMFVHLLPLLHHATPTGSLG